MTPDPAAGARDCTLRLLVDRPDRFRPAGVSGAHSQLGHVFIQLVDAAGHARTLGWYANCCDAPRTHQPAEDRLNGLADAFKKVRGHLRDDSARRFDDEAVYRLTQAQHDRIAGFLDAWQRDPPRYSLATNNCVSFAFRAAEAGGLAPPLSLAGLDLPLAATAWIALGSAWTRLKQGLADAAHRLGDRLAGGQRPHAFRPGVSAVPPAPAPPLAAAPPHRELRHGP